MTLFRCLIDPGGSCQSNQSSIPYWYPTLVRFGRAMPSKAGRESDQIGRNLLSSPMAQNQKRKGKDPMICVLYENGSAHLVGLTWHHAKISTRENLNFCRMPCLQAEAQSQSKRSEKTQHSANGASEMSRMRAKRLAHFSGGIQGEIPKGW